jgi:hypothetical protein
MLQDLKILMPDLIVQKDRYLTIQEKMQRNAELIMICFKIKVTLFPEKVHLPGDFILSDEFQASETILINLFFEIKIFSL